MGQTTEDTLSPQLLGAKGEIFQMDAISLISFVLGCHLHPLIEILPYIRSHQQQIVLPTALARDFQGASLMRADRPSTPLPIKTIMQRAQNPDKD